jgi:type I restriction enzyme M protein
MKDTQLMIQKPSLLVTAVNMVDELPLTQGDAKGDLYEYLLSKLTTAGVNGQFRTPRHIIRLMVEILAPWPDEVVGDPACATFLDMFGDPVTNPKGWLESKLSEITDIQSGITKGRKLNGHETKEVSLIEKYGTGIIERTIPDKPTSRLQKYRLTDKGRKLLHPSQKGWGK